MEPSRSVFVGGLPSKTQRFEVEKFFAKYGEVESCMLKKNLKTGRSLGFGTVTFKEEASHKKILSSLPIEYQGRMIDVKPYWTKEGLAKNTEEEMKRKLFLGYLPKGTENHHLTEHFQRHGKVVCAFVIKDLATQENRNYGYVVFETAEDLNNVMSIPALRWMRVNGVDSELLLIPQTNKSEISRYKLVNSQIYGNVVEPHEGARPTWNSHKDYYQRGGRYEDRGGKYEDQGGRYEYRGGRYDRGRQGRGSQYERPTPFGPRRRVRHAYDYHEDHDDYEDQWQKRIPVKGNPADHENNWISHDSENVQSGDMHHKKDGSDEASSNKIGPVDTPQLDTTWSNPQAQKNPQKANQGPDLQVEKRPKETSEERVRSRKETVIQIKKELQRMSQQIDVTESNYKFNLQDPNDPPQYIGRLY